MPMAEGLAIQSPSPARDAQLIPTARQHRDKCDQQKTANG
jgi:hypothetical protein